MNELHALAAILATWRLTELVTEDRVTEPFRRRLGWYVLGCPRCASVWAGIICTAVFVWFPWANWPLALSWTWIARKAHARADTRLWQDAHGRHRVS